MKGIRQTHVQVFDSQLLSQFRLSQGDKATLVFESGAGQWSDHWVPVIKHLPGDLNAVAYDRAGLGRSSPTKRPRGLVQMAEELHELVDCLKIQGPLVLVGHSFGASVIRCFAGLYPQRCAALVFVDGWHSSFTSWENTHRPPMNPWAEKLFFLFARLGGLSLINRIFAQPNPGWQVSDEQWLDMQGRSSRPGFFKTMQREMALHEQGDRHLQQTRALTLPVLAIVCKRTLLEEQVPRDDPLDEHNEAWATSSCQLAQLSPLGELELEEESSHMLILESPRRVAQRIADFLARTKC